MEQQYIFLEVGDSLEWGILELFRVSSCPHSCHCIQLPSDFWLWWLWAAPYPSWVAYRVGVAAGALNWCLKCDCSLWTYPQDSFCLFFPPTISATWCEGQKSSLLQRTAAVAPWGCQLSQIFLFLSFPTDIATTLIVSLNVLKENFPLSSCQFSPTISFTKPEFQVITSVFTL